MAASTPPTSPPPKQAKSCELSSRMKSAHTSK